MTLMQAILEVKQHAQPYRCEIRRANRNKPVIPGDHLNPGDELILEADDFYSDDWIVGLAK